MSHQYDDEQLLEAILAALRARDMELVVVLLHRLAVQNPRAAQDVLDAVELAGRVGV